MNTKKALHQVEDSWSPYARLPRNVRNWLRQIWGNLGFNAQTATVLRYEVDMAMLRVRCALSRKHAKAVRDVRSHPEIKLHVGCGNVLLTGWVNLDCYPPPQVESIEVLTFDMRRGFPLSDGSVVAIFSEHFLEHIPFNTVRDVFVPEFRRMMTHDAVLRIGVPNGQYFIDQYIRTREGNGDLLYQRIRGEKSPMTILNEQAHGYGHQFLYDFETLKAVLSNAGFSNVVQKYAGETDHAVFSGLDRDDDWRKAITLYVEARKL